MEKVTIKDVAELAGVSVATVSRVLNGNCTVKDEYVQRTMEAVRALNFKPSIAAKYIRGKTSKVIAMLVPEITSPFYARIANGAITRAQQLGQSILLMTSDRDPAIEIQCLQQLSDNMIDGLIYGPLEQGRPLEERREILTVPTVIVAHRHVLDGVPHIYVDNFDAAYRSTKYLLKLGRRRIVFLAGFWLPETIDRNALLTCTRDCPESGVWSAFDRLLGYREALEEEGIPFQQELVRIVGFDYEAGFQAMQASFSAMQDIDAVIAPNDMSAAGVLEFLKRQNIRVPEHVSVIGHGDVLIPQIAVPPLTSIDQNPFRLGAEAVDTVSQLIAGRPAHDVVIGVSLSIRGSTCHI